MNYREITESAKENLSPEAYSHVKRIIDLTELKHQIENDFAEYISSNCNSDFPEKLLSHVESTRKLIPTLPFDRTGITFGWGFNASIRENDKIATLLADAIAREIRQELDALIL